MCVFCSPPQLFFFVLFAHLTVCFVVLFKQNNSIPERTFGSSIESRSPVQSALHSRGKVESSGVGALLSAALAEDVMAA